MKKQDAIHALEWLERAAAMLERCAPPGVERYALLSEIPAIKEALSKDASKRSYHGQVFSLTGVPMLSVEIVSATAYVSSGVSFKNSSQLHSLLSGPGCKVQLKQRNPLSALSDNEADYWSGQ